jgi:hypothetical protein
LRLLAGLRLDGRRQVEVTAYAVRTFFDAHLKGTTGSAGALPAMAVPEIVVLP